MDEIMLDDQQIQNQETQVCSNPAWMVHLKPFSAIISEQQPRINFSLDQINNNDYEGMQLSKLIGILSLESDDSLGALISYDGAIAIPQSENFPTRIDGITKLNEILCCLLLGGIHAEVLHPHELDVGTLYEKRSLFSNLPSLHNQLRCNWASISERYLPLMHPRVLHFNDLRLAYNAGQEIIKSIPSFTPFFLLNGYTSLINQNNNDALNNLWIVVEQITEILWKKIYIKCKDSYPRQVRCLHTTWEEAKFLKNIATKHKLLRLAKIISRQNYKILESARKSRNKLVHSGRRPEYEVIFELWGILSELLELATCRRNIGLRKIKVGKELNWSNPQDTNFDEWKELVAQMK